jgi:regulator of protease activity HflC (stomatin/prohibitin superfamily)
MGWFILAIILAIAGVLALAAGGLAKGTRAGYSGRQDSYDYSRPVRVIGAVALVIAFLLYVLGGLKSVPVKNIGVPQAFGAVTGAVYEPGIHETWTPWLHLADVNETVQTTTFEQSNHDCLSVRIGGQQQACADVTIQWQIKADAADGLFSDYANQGDLMTEITNAVVVRELKQVVNQVLGDYNPITDVQSVTNTNSSTSQFSQFGPQILTAMRADIGNRINVLTVLLPQLHYDATVEAKLNSIQQAYANYAIAQENVKVNQENAKAFVKLGTPNVSQLIAQCLTDVKAAGNLPAGFSCFPGSGSGLAISSK